MRKRQRKKNKKNAWRNYIRRMKKRGTLKSISSMSKADTLDMLRVGEIGHMETVRIVTHEEHLAIHNGNRRVYTGTPFEHRFEPKAIHHEHGRRGL